MNCLAWQEFIALNWKAAPGKCGVPDPNAGPAQFGMPNPVPNQAMGPVVWETYADETQVFRPGAAAPLPWCHNPQLALVAPSMVQENVEPSLLKFIQAGTSSVGWLTAQNHHVTMYEIRLNEDEFNYINRNNLYNARIQQTFAEKTGINLPDGTKSFSTYGSIGAMEVKAAWLQIDPSQYPDYLTAEANVTYPGDPTPQHVVVGLVGLHIIHKTLNGQQFVWATFEHDDLDPTAAEVQNHTLAPPYIYYSPSCNKSSDPYKCVPNSVPQDDCAGSLAPRKKGSSTNPPYSDPNQVVRCHPISSAPGDNITSLNQAILELIQKSNPKSVFLHYRLVDVLWSTANPPITKPTMTPLTTGDPLPNMTTNPVANTTMETYEQDHSCLTCHMDAYTADTPPNENEGWSTDYSFVFYSAQNPPAKRLSHLPLSRRLAAWLVRSNS